MSRAMKWIAGPKGETRIGEMSSGRGCMAAPKCGAMERRALYMACHSERARAVCAAGFSFSESVDESVFVGDFVGGVVAFLTKLSGALTLLGVGAIP
jgi:hypothetical protein